MLDDIFKLPFIYLLYSKILNNCIELIKVKNINIYNKQIESKLCFTNDMNPKESHDLLLLVWFQWRSKLGQFHHLKILFSPSSPVSFT